MNESLPTCMTRCFDGSIGITLLLALGWKVKRDLMHQAHAIPWNTLASHFTFVRDNPRKTPRTTGIFPTLAARPTRGSDLDHFVRVLADTIRSFARTERAKHPPGDVLASLLSSGPVPVKLFDDKLLDRYPKYLDARMQSPNYWVRRAVRTSVTPGTSGSGTQYVYTCAHGDLVNAVNVLLYATDLRAVLCLAHLDFPHADPNPGQVSESEVAIVDSGGAPIDARSHSRPPFASLVRLSWGYYVPSGVQWMAWGALHAYLYINFAYALDILADGRWMETRYFGWLVGETTGAVDYDAQRLPHRAFWAGLGVGKKELWSLGTRMHRGSGPTMRHAASEERPQVFWTWTRECEERTRDYVKELFRLMYAYEMVMCECGITDNVWWEQEITLALERMTGLKARWKGTACAFS